MATQRPNGRWRAQVLIGTDADGKRIYKSFEADTEDEADYAALTFKLGKGKRTKEPVTLRMAIEAYINSKDGLLSPATISSYRGILKNFGPYLDIRLAMVNALNLQTAVTEYASTPKKQKHNGYGTVSAKTVKNAFGLINATLRQNGIRIEGITLPQRQKVEYTTPFENGLKEILDVMRGTEYELPVLLAAWCGLRRSEILGLTFNDIDFDRKTIHIRRANVYIGKESHLKGTKNVQSTRSVHLPDHIAALIQNTPHESNEEYIVKLKGMTLTNGFTSKLKRRGLPHTRFHDLRHAFVSILTANGVDQKYIQEMGGWSNSTVMNSVYKQTSDTLKQSISAAVDGIFLSLMQPNATKHSGESQ